MRPANIYEVQPPITIVSNTASAASAARPFLRTSSSSTNFIVGTAAANTVTFSMKTVNDGGTPIAAIVDLSVACTTGGDTVDVMTKSSGTYLSPLVDALITGGVTVTSFVAYTAQPFTPTTDHGEMHPRESLIVWMR